MTSLPIWKEGTGTEVKLYDQRMDTMTPTRCRRGLRDRGSGSEGTIDLLIKAVSCDDTYIAIALSLIKKTARIDSWSASSQIVRGWLTACMAHLLRQLSCDIHGRTPFRSFINTYALYFLEILAVTLPTRTTDEDRHGCSAAEEEARRRQLELQ